MPVIRLVLILNKTLVIENEDSWETGTRPLAVESVRGYSTFVHKKSNGFRHLQTQQLHLYFGCKQSKGSDVCSAAPDGSYETAGSAYDWVEWDRLDGDILEEADRIHKLLLAEVK